MGDTASRANVGPAPGAAANARAQHSQGRATAETGVEDHKPVGS